MRACRLGGAAFLPVALGILSELMGIPPGKHLIGDGLEVFQYHNDPKHTANVSEIMFGVPVFSGCILIKSQRNNY